MDEFGNQFTKNVEMLLQNFSLATYNNGYTSEYFKPTRGLFQGNPIASELFTVLIELLAVQVRLLPAIKGLKHEGTGAFNGPVC